MEKSYLFATKLGRFIINDERSKIGYSYPRIFVETPSGKYFNYDVALACCFFQKKSDFESWIDGTEIRGSIDLFRKVCEDLRLNRVGVTKLIQSLQEENR